MLANDEDVDGDPLAVTILTGPVSGTLTPPDAPGGSWTYTPDADFFGDDSFTYSISDALNPPAIATVSIPVTPVNDAPVLAPVADRSSAQGDQVSIALSEIGGATCRERVCTFVYISVVAGSLKKNKNRT